MLPVPSPLWAAPVAPRRRGVLTPCPARSHAEGAAVADRWLTRASAQLAQELGLQDRSPGGGAGSGAGGPGSSPRAGGGAEPLNPGAPGGGGRGRASARDAAGGAEAAAARAAAEADARLAAARVAADAQRRRAEDEVEDALRAMKERLGRRG